MEVRDHEIIRFAFLLEAANSVFAAVGCLDRVTFATEDFADSDRDILFVINHKQTPLIKPGKSATLTVRFATKGRFRYRCSVPGHAAGGMKGVFTVR